MELNTIHLTDALNGLKSLPDESVDCIVTSPPYWQMRDYGIGGIEWPDTIQVKFFNNFDELDNKSFRLFLKIDNSENVKQGDRNYQIAKFYVSDKLEIPIWWSRNDGTVDRPTNIVEKVYLGEYSETKYIMFLEELEKGGESFDGTDMNVMKKYAIRLKYTLEEYERVNGEPKRDENGRVITVPVAG